MADDTAQLTDRQRLFARHYVACLNATEAASRAGYAGDRNTLGVQGHENLRNPKIRALVDELLAAATITPAEILGRLTAFARGDLGEFFVASGRGVRLDLKRAKELGLMPLVKSYSRTKDGVRIELYSAADALARLGEHYKLWGKGADILKLIDLSKLSDAQLDRLAEGEDPIKVLLG